MHLPDEILAIIREFFQPITRPGWRNLHKMTSYNFHRAILKQYNRRRNSRVIYNFVCEYSRHPQDKYMYWWDGYMDYNRSTVMVQLRLLN